ncbi:MAG TPA: peptidylprolyl isomerase [Actinomycetota bacterium]|nr:peptidylprolyl isomerase [Actinomycetota bacterium]
METSRGEIAFELFADRTPATVNNFVFLARNGFYDGVPFHRVIEGFMLQGGDPTGTGRGGPGYTFDDEIVDDLRFDQPGLLAMANAGPATNGSQFFVTVSSPRHLDGRHTIFGRVVEGYEVVEDISRMSTDSADRPLEDAVIERVRIDED